MTPFVQVILFAFFCVLWLAPPARKALTRIRPAHAVLPLATLALFSLAACSGDETGRVSEEMQSAQTTAEQESTPFETFSNSVLNKVVQRGTLVVGMEVEYWPFEYADEQGNPTGFDVDIATLAAKELGVDIEIKDIEWTGLIPALQTGKVDMIISGMTATLERAKSITFSDPYFETGLTILASTRAEPPVNGVADLNVEGRVIAVKTGTTGDLWATENLPEARINRFKDETACVREVVTGRAHAFLYDMISIAKHHAQNPDNTVALLEPFTYEPFGIAIRKGDFDFHDWLNQYLATIRRDGRYDEIYSKNFAQVGLGE